MKQQTKNITISYCRVVAMTFIIICHIIKYYTFIPGASILGNVFDVGVYIFLFISGVIYGGRTIKKWGEYYFKRYLKVLLPAQIWVIAVFVFCGYKTLEGFVIYVLGLKGFFHIQDLLSLSCPNLGLGHTWFITVIFLCYLILPLLQKGKKVLTDTQFRNVVWGTWGIVIVLAFFNLYLFHFATFLSGYMAGKNGLFDKGADGKLTLRICWLSIFLMLLRIYLRTLWDGTILYNRVIAPLCMGVLGIAMVVMIHYICTKYEWVNQFARLKGFTYIENYSYYIFIVHYTFVSEVRYNLFEKYDLLLATVVFIFVTIVSAFVLKRISSLMNRWFERRYVMRIK